MLSIAAPFASVASDLAKQKRIPLSAQRADIPESLAQVMVGTATAREIKWLR